MARKSTAEPAAKTETVVEAEAQTFAGLTLDQIKAAIEAMSRADMKKLEDAMKKRKEAIIAANKLAAEKKKAATEAKRTKAEAELLDGKNGDVIKKVLDAWGTSGNDRDMQKALNNLPKPALAYIARTNGLKGYSAMKKSELVDFLMDEHGKAGEVEVDMAA